MYYYHYLHQKYKEETYNFKYDIIKELRHIIDKHIKIASKNLNLKK